MDDRTPETAHWDEDASRLFIDTAELFVPMRAEQIATIRDLIPAERDDSVDALPVGASATQSLSNRLLHF